MARTRKKANNIDPQLGGLLDSEMLERLKKSGFTGSLEVEWENGAVKSCDLSSTLRWGKRKRRRFTDMFDE